MHSAVASLVVWCPSPWHQRGGRHRHTRKTCSRCARRALQPPQAQTEQTGIRGARLCLAFGQHPIARSIRECMQELTPLVLNGLSRVLPFSDSTERVGLAGSHSLALELPLLLHEQLLLLDIEGAEKKSASLSFIQMAVNEPAVCGASNASSVDGLVDPALWPALALSGLPCPPTSPRTAVASVAARPSTTRSDSSSRESERRKSGGKQGARARPASTARACVSLPTACSQSSRLVSWRAQLPATATHTPSDCQRETAAATPRSTLSLHSWMLRTATWVVVE